MGIIKNFGFIIPEVLEKRDRKAKPPSRHKDNYAAQAKKDFDRYKGLNNGS